MAPPLILQQVSDILFTKYVSESNNWNDLGVKCGYKLAMGHTATPSFALQGKAKANIIKRIQLQNLSYTHICGLRWCAPIKPILEMRQKRRKGTTLRVKLERAMIPYTCAWCKCENMTFKDGEWHWHDKPLKLQVDHINGMNGTESQDDVENLRFLCANCHTQTSNWGGKRKRKSILAVS